MAICEEEKVLDGIKIKNVKTFKEDDTFYMTLVFEHDDKKNNHVVEYTIPKIKINPKRVCLQREFGGPLRLYESISFLFGKLDVKFTDFTYQKKRLKNIAYVQRVIEEPPKEMTLEEIEQQLGYKIKVITKK